MMHLLGYLSFLTMFIGQQFVVEEKETDTVVLAVYEDYELQYDQGYQLYFQDYLFKSFSKEANVKITSLRNHIVVFVIEKNIGYLYVWDHYQRLITSNIYPDRFSFEFDLLVYKDSLYLVGGIIHYSSDAFKFARKSHHAKADAFIVRFDEDYHMQEVKVFGGQLDDGFISINIVEDFMYLIGKKETLSGGDFGHGGGSNYGYIIAKLDMELRLLNYQIFRDDIWIDWQVNESIHIITDQRWYVMSLDLTLISTTHWEEPCRWAYFSPFDFVIIVKEVTAHMYNTQTMHILGYWQMNSHDAFMIGEDWVYKINQDNIVAFNVYDTKHISASINRIQEDAIVCSLFKELAVTRVEIEPFFDISVYGTYYITYYFKDFAYVSEITVAKEVNITENMIYPIGYPLRFTGVGYLNGDKILNNHKVLTTGEHVLSLYGASGEASHITFQIDAHQIQFEEDRIKQQEFTVYPNQTFTLECHLDNPMEYPIVGVTINGVLRTDFILEDNVITISINNSTLGEHAYYLQGIHYLINNQVVITPMDVVYNVYVLKKPMTYEAMMYDDKRHVWIESLFSDQQQTIRGFYMTIIGNQEVNQIYAAKNVDLVWDYFVVGKMYHIKLGVLINVGKGMEEVELITLRFVPTKPQETIGIFEVVQKSESIEVMRMAIFKNEALKEIVCQNQTIYTYQHSSLWLPLMTLFLMGGSAFAITLVARIKKKNQKSQKPSH